MRVKCVICDKIENIENDSFQAKRLRNRPIYTYMCQTCNDRITEKTNERIATGNFHLYRSKIQPDDWD
ncbi:YlaI family protein [Niallia sp. Krafla_26]|uniref:YlaI family protein n=1 Tax=Niallia sp. Krafla_26 TaxID=3064703 RepID=UPI003D165029